MRFTVAAAAALAATMMTAPSIATTLVADSGWQDDTVDTVGTPSENSPWTFTVTKASVLSVTDDFIPGDIYTLSGDITGVTTFYAGSASDVQATGSHGGAWTDASFSKIAVNVGPGTYSFSIAGDGAGGLPAGLGVRLDTSAVPETATWAMMVGGFGMAGAAMRRRKRTIVSFG